MQLQKKHDLVKDLQERETHGNAVMKRAIPVPWVLGAVLSTANQVFSFYGLARSCQEFTKSTPEAVLCVWGAISTAATFIGIGVKGVSELKGMIGDLGIRHGKWKRADRIRILEASRS